MSLRYVFPCLVIPLSIAACSSPAEGPSDAPPEEALGMAEEGIGGPGMQCPNLCNESSACNKTCLLPDNNQGSTCGQYGVCNQSCWLTSWCNSSAPCDRPCADPWGTRTCGQQNACQPCSSICNAATPCDRLCDSGPSVITCSAYGMCQACSSSLCSGPQSCGQSCSHNGAMSTCDAWSQATADDADLDGIPDALERALARRFTPTLFLRRESYNGVTWADFGQIYKAGGYTPNANWPFVVRRVTPEVDTLVTWHGITTGMMASCSGINQCLEIVFMIPYNWDLGDNITWATSHRGDGEMYAVMVTRTDPILNVAGVVQTPRWDTPWSVARNDASQWVAFEEFASQHMCSEPMWGVDADTSHFRRRIFRPELDGATELFVSEGKHGNYFSRAECEGGGAWFDNCDESDIPFIHAQILDDGGMGPLRNAGEQACHAHPSLDPTTAFPGADATYLPSGTYHVWSDLPFGDDHEGRGTALLRPGTLRWLDDYYACW